jgi:xanthine dehydrogenase accessory factor
MKDILSEVERWRKSNTPVALATVVDTWGSSPRGVGAKMAITAEGGIAGSVSGGCVEGAVVEVGQEVLLGTAPQLLHFGVSDETAWGVGLACGGEIEVFVEPLADEHLTFVELAIERDTPVASLTIIRGPAAALGAKMSARGNRGEEVWGQLDSQWGEAGLAALRRGIRQNRSGRQVLVEAGEQTIEAFVDVIPPQPTLIMIGGVHISVALAKIGAALGQRTIVVDPRRTFGTRERFPEVDELLTVWPQEAFEGISIQTSTAIAVLTHDPKIDDPALMAALPSPAYYVGALGSRRTHAKRVQRLTEAGMSPELLGRLHAPIGLDLGAITPEEIALAVMAEIVQTYRTGDTDS